ncbi:MAG: 6-pyruvoyl tetrahydropterin synthase family protein [Bdellovibrionales bacterium]
MSFEINLAKENFKFSGTHFTILSPEKAERLHGHNYYVQVSLLVEQLDPILGLAFDFNSIKPLVREACAALDEFILLPQNSPFLKIRHEAGQVEVTFAGRRYSFPQNDVRELPLVNITSEELSRFLAGQINTLAKNLKFSALTVSVEETRGQGVSYTLRR